MLAQPSALWQVVPSVFLKLSCFIGRGMPCSQQIAVLLASQVNPGNVGVALEKATQRYQGREGTTWFWSIGQCYWYWRASQVAQW